MIDQTIAWLTATGAPNWVVVLLLLTAPMTWSKRVEGRIGPLLDQLLPGKGSE